MPHDAASFGISILLSTEGAEEKYTALLLPILQRKGSLVDNPLATSVIGFIALLFFRVSLLRNKGLTREDAKNLAKDRLAKMQREGGGRVGDGYAA